jgi:hypothetical protein
MDQVDAVSQDQCRGGDGPALVNGRGDRTQQNSMQHGRDFIRVRRCNTDE